MVIARFNSPEVAAALTPSEDKQRVHELVTLQTKQKLLLQQLPTDYDSGLFNTKEEYAAARDAATAALTTTNEELQKIQTTKAVATIPAGQTIAEFFDTASLEAQRKVILLLVDYVTILPGNPHGKMWRGRQFDTSKIKIVWKV